MGTWLGTLVVNNWAVALQSMPCSGRMLLKETSTIGKNSGIKAGTGTRYYHTS